jgi:hypothetical protein
MLELELCGDKCHHHSPPQKQSAEKGDIWGNKRIIRGEFSRPRNPYTRVSDYKILPSFDLMSSPSGPRTSILT